MTKQFANIKSAVLYAMFVLLPLTSFAQSRRADKDTKNWRYDIECAGIGSDGTYLVKVWSYSKNPKVAMAQAKKNAVHGVVFKGFAGGRGCTAQKPLAASAGIEEEKAAFFESFFADGGNFMKYASEASEAVGAGDVIKAGKEYKVGIVVSVQKDQLRKDLEAAGIVRSLTSGF